MSENETAYVLQEGAWTSTEAARFDGVPGDWRNDEPIAVSDLGYTPKEFADLVKERNLPLKKTTAKPSGEPLSSVDLPSEPVSFAPPEVEEK